MRALAIEQAARPRALALAREDRADHDEDGEEKEC
jgi:hypothetical protein